jgi:hypothetical protein
VELVGFPGIAPRAPPPAKADALILASQVFPSYVTRERAVTKQSALAKLKEKRALKQIQNARAP